MRMIVVGPGRAGGSLALAARRAGHEVVGLLPRRETLESFPQLAWDELLPRADLLVVAVRDDAIEEVAERLVPMAQGISAAVHLSGFTPTSSLQPLATAGLEVGSFHPLQTLPDPLTGSQALEGSWVAVTAPPQLAEDLHRLARSLGCEPFALDDKSKPLYHAAASAASNYLVTTLGLAEELFEAVGVPFEAARPLALSVVKNVFALGSRQALTGPVARGDQRTVAGQLAAVDLTGAGEDFRTLARTTAKRAGTLDRFPELW